MKKLLAMGLGIGLATCVSAAAQAKEMTVTGNLVDTYCYSAMGAHGPSHAKCAMGCAKQGIPVGLVEKGSSKMYILLPPKNDEPLPSSVVENMEKEVTVTGNEYDTGGVSFLSVNTLK